jgi:hypothetical protein
MDPLDLLILARSGPEPRFDPVMRDFLCNCRDELHSHLRRGGLLEARDLGGEVPWLWRLTFGTRGLVRDAAGEIRAVEHHVVAVSFFPDYLRRAERFEMLSLIEPHEAFHPNLLPPAICVEVRPRESLVEICESLHALFSWRLKQLQENDALNKDACAWGRQYMSASDARTDFRPLFGRPFKITLEPTEAKA